MKDSHHSVPSTAATELEQPPKKITLAIVWGPTRSVHCSFKVKNFCQSAKSKNLLLSPLSFFAWLLQIPIHKDTEMQRDVTTVFDICIGSRKRVGILRASMTLFLHLELSLWDWKQFIKKLEIPPDIEYVERNSRLEDFGKILQEGSMLNRFKGFIEINIGKDLADNRIPDDVHVTFAMNIGDTDGQLKRALQKCVVCGICNVRTHCLDCGALYCSREHQLDDWARHKSYCKVVKTRTRRVYSNLVRMANNKSWSQLWYSAI